MPVLSLHNTYSLPSGSASYTLGLSGAPNVASYSYPTSVSALERTLLSGTTGVSNLIGGTGALSGLSSTAVNPFGKITDSRHNTRKTYFCYKRHKNHSFH